MSDDRFIFCLLQCREREICFSLKKNRFLSLPPRARLVIPPPMDGAGEGHTPRTVFGDGHASRRCASCFLFTHPTHHTPTPSDGPARRSGRARVVSERVAVVTADALAATTAARLAALEADDGGDAAAAAAEGAASDDDEFVPDAADFGDDDSDAEDGGGRPLKKARALPAPRALVPGAPLPRSRLGRGGATAAGGATKTRAARAERRGPKPLADVLEEDGLTRGHVPPPHWVSASLGPSPTPPRRWCSMCGLPAKYTCPRCRSRTCGRRCGAAHAETRCLKFVS